MIIQSSNVALGSQRSYEKTFNTSFVTTRWNAANSSISDTTSLSFGSVYSEQESLYNNYNEFAKNLQNSTLSDYSNQTPFEPISAIRSPLEHKSLEEITRSTFRALIDMLYKSRGLVYSGMDSSTNEAFSMPSETTVWNQVTDATYYFSEEESVAFSGKGMAFTADGRTIDFDVTFAMSRSFEQTIETSAFTQYTQVLTDPLVINLDSNPTSISPQTFFFDIDCDGVEDEISSLDLSSGFLALDLNEDGKINDGSELFGTKSGNGFNDLASYDEDGNGWIDEADSVYSKLKVWTKDADGNDKLLTLSEADVGAICLQQARTQYSYTDEENNLLGMMKSSGIYLKESGGAGTVSQIDLAKH